MTTRIFPISALLAGTALLLAGSGLFGTLLAIRGGLEGFSAGTLGLIMSAYFVGFLIGTRVAPRIILEVGHIRAFAIFAAVCSTTGVLHAIWVQPVFWMLLRVLTGISIVGLYNVVESWLTSQASPSTRGSIFAVYMIVNLLAMAGGQWLILLAPAESFELFSLVTILVALSLVPVALTRLPQPEVTDAAKVSLRTLMGMAPVAVVAGFVSGVVMGAFWGMGPLFAQRIGLDAGGVALLMSLTIVGGAALQFPVGHYSDKHDRRRVVGQVMAAAALFAIAINLALQPLPASVYPLMFLYGGLAFSIYPLCAAHLSDHLSHEQLVGGSSQLLLLHGAGAALGPVLAGQFMTWIGTGSLPLFFAILLVPVALYAAHHCRPRAEDAELAEEQSSHFLPMVRTSTAALELLAEDLPEPELSLHHPAADEEAAGKVSAEPDVTGTQAAADADASARDESHAPEDEESVTATGMP